VSAAVDCVHHAVGVLRQGKGAETANRLLIEVVPVLNRLAASVAELKQFAPASDPARLEAEAVLKLFREGGQ
jgi:hypothetical protein